MKPNKRPRPSLTSKPQRATTPRPEVNTPEENHPEDNLPEQTEVDCSNEGFQAHALCNKVTNVFFLHGLRSLSIGDIETGLFTLQALAQAKPTHIDVTQPE
uniref:Uncharacterized protein n=1 Tax=Cacopsylla melanoneura TaxID=428564 RepID=A0A8D9ARN8_9HEMI